ncbi:MULTISPECIES: gamma carbonic anhydrase family protein [Dictyoglomus]|uniref:Carbonic anhydrase/acetyltransferase, isoleucine patch superfamily n=1 Tax=Dictyoglomus turgidum (strain DSM 6724 / Z-1310) TaxID=515635 RepID=B8DYJ7_DICTD|nr:MULTISPECIES: gamma carbonic anhydrase family protein [Dictyoglomus]ACK41379.1 carbonic anhydrase/acetyltransferase, isoleucine patch superfamily [Dictyoglomus turgidum DSM 6724]HBU31616.1 gamma carbonic anhydrase family protein [Dictyoglomus sp.]
MLKSFDENLPQVDREVYISDRAVIIGKVTLKRGVNIWDFAVIRGDLDSIFIDEYTNIQENVVIHVDEGKPVYIGKYVTIGHSAIIHGCKIEDNTLIGMGAIILDGAVIGRNSIIGAGTLIPQGKEIPEGSVVIGVPGKIVRSVREEEILHIKRNAELYYQLSKKYWR